MDKAEAIAAIKARWRDVVPGQDAQVDYLRPEDAPGVCQLIYSIYADKYPILDYYIPERLLAANASGDVVTVVVRTARGDIVAQGATYRTSTPNPHLFEYGQYVVLQSYRGNRFTALMDDLLARYWRTHDHVHGFWGEGVCNHPVTQKSAVVLGAVPCGVEMALMPDGAMVGEGAGSRRVSCVLLSKVLRDRHRTLMLPSCYRDALTPVVTALGDCRDATFCDGTEPAVPLSEITVQSFGGARVTRCHVHVIGADFAARINGIDRQARDEGLAVLQYYLAAESDATPWAAAVLRDHGCFLGGLAPLWMEQDALLMQKLFAVEPDFDAMVLYNDQIRALAEQVRADYRQVNP